jgi:hypothetical protein
MFASLQPYVALAAFADGGEPPVDVPSLVGERGPELFIPKTAGTIVPNHALRGGTGNSFGSSTLHIHVNGAGDPRAVAREVIRRIPDELKSRYGGFSPAS